MPWLVAATVLVSDRISKLAIMRRVDSLDPRTWIEVMPGLTLTHVHNRGIAFSLLNDIGPLARIALHTAIGVAVVLIAWMVTHQSRRGWVPSLAFGLILGGAAGNLLDRIVWGWVVDFIHVWISIGDRTYAWPDFNVADSAISIGVTLLILFELVTMRAQPAQDEAAGAPAQAPATTTSAQDDGPAGRSE
jgi:signal peptidase II